MVNPRRIPQLRNAYRPRSSKPLNWQPWLDGATIIIWASMLSKYALTGQINVLLHPDYRWLAHAAAATLFGIGGFKVWQAWRLSKQRLPQSDTDGSLQHTTFFPKHWSSIILCITAMIGLVFTPKPFASQTALNRGITDTLTATRSQPEPFRTAINPEDRSLIDWRRTLNVYPEPDAYTGDPVNVQGFVIQPPDYPEDYFLVARFVITCCAADVYPVGLPVKLPSNSSGYPPDTWLEVKGKMATNNINGDRQLVIVAESLKEIPEPADPYNY